MRIQFCKIASKGIFWEYNSAECLKENVLRIPFCRIASKGIFWKYNSVELLQMKCLRIQFRKIASKRKCCENTTLQSCLKWKCGNTTLESCLRLNVLRIQFYRIASMGSVGIQLCKVSLKKIFWEYNSTELPQRKYFENTIL